MLRELPIMGIPEWTGYAMAARGYEIFQQMQKILNELSPKH